MGHVKIVGLWPWITGKPARGSVSGIGSLDPDHCAIIFEADPVAGRVIKDISALRIVLMRNLIPVNG